MHAVSLSDPPGALSVSEKHFIFEANCAARSVLSQPEIPISKKTVMGLEIQLRGRSTVAFIED